MSFGASPSDIIIVVTFCRAIYRKCRDAGGEYDEISREVKALHVVLRHLKYEVEAPESPLNRDQSIWARQLAPIIGDCDFTLRQLDVLITKYGRLAAGNGSPTSPRVLWDKVRFGSNEMDELGGVRVKLISHKTSLTLFLDTIQLHESGKMATVLDNHGGQLDVILDKVDKIAAKTGQGNGSIMTNYEDDDKEVWKQFRRELVAEGFSSDVLQQHKDVLRAYIREIDQKGLLEEISFDPKGPSKKPIASHTERWLESVQSAPHEDAPPSFKSENTGSDDSGSKEMMYREENHKFPTSMKFERPKPETRAGEPQRQLTLPVSGQDRRWSEGNQGHKSVVPRLIASDEKEVFYVNTSGSSDGDSEPEAAKPTIPSSNAMVIRTSELIALSQVLTLRPPEYSPMAPQNLGAFGEQDMARSMPLRPKKAVEFGYSPHRSGSIANESSPRLATGANRDDATPRPEQIRLAPDEHGNEIPADAKWTRINRRLVSPEVLDQARKRYEARPEFVAVLGVLTRFEIEDLAARTAALRHARHLRNHPPPPQQAPPPQPPRPMQSQNQKPIPIPIPVPVPPNLQRGHSGRDTPSTDPSSYSSSSESSHLPPHRKYKKKKRGYQGSDIGVPISGYPNPFGQPVPPLSPMWSPANPTSVPVAGSAQPHGVRFPASPPERNYYTYDAPRRDRERSKDKRRDRDKDVDRERERDRDRDDGRERERERAERRKYGSRSAGASGDGNGATRHGSYAKANIAGDSGRVRNSRWKENLTAAGIGGAAVSLLNVLSEAAEGI